jgi:hypothetical protein
MVVVHVLQAAVSRVTDIPRSYLKDIPPIKALFEHRAGQYYRHQEEQSHQREDQLLKEVQRAIER